MLWHCERGCGAGDSKEYASPQDAQRYAQVFDRQDSEELGRHAPLVGLLPLRLLWVLRKRRQRQANPPK